MKRRRALLAGLALTTLGSMPSFAQAPLHTRRVVVFGPDSSELLPHNRSEFNRLGVSSLVLTVVLLEGNVLEREARARAAVAERPDVIIVHGSYRAQLLQRLTREIPIVFIEVSDPVQLGLVKSLRRPGGNITGASSRNTELLGKRVELLKEIRPGAKRVGLLAYAGTAHGDIVQEFERSALALAMQPVLVSLPWGTSPERAAEPSRAALREAQVDVAYCYMNYDGSVGLVRNPERGAVPTVFFHHKTVEAGGLISLGEWWLDPDNRAIGMAVKILRGASPATMPVDQLSRPWLAVNLATARAVGAAIPQSILTRANQVVE